MLFKIVTLIGGFIILYLGAEGLVRGAKRLSITLGIHPLVVGITVVAFGTSAPELVVSLTAIFRNSPAIAVGNIVGSNVANMALILGLSAFLSPMKVHDRTVRIEVPIVIFAGILFYIFAGNQEITRIEGIFLLGGFVAFFVFAVLPQILKSWTPLPEDLEIELDNPVTDEEVAEARAQQTIVTDILLLALGIAGLVYGGELTVSSARYIARYFDISEMVIGATIVAFGTSLPELATSIVAAMKNEPDISVGNVIGSNLFNILIVGGASATARGYIPIETDTLMYDFPIMVGLSIIIMPLLRTGRELDRLEGLGLIMVYIAYILLIIIRPHFLGNIFPL